MSSILFLLIYLTCINQCISILVSLRLEGIIVKGGEADGMSHALGKMGASHVGVVPRSIHLPPAYHGGETTDLETDSMYLSRWGLAV